MRTEFSCIPVLRVASGPRVKLHDFKSALNSPVVCIANHSKAMYPVLLSIFVALWLFIRDDLYCLSFRFVLHYENTPIQIY